MKIVKFKDGKYAVRKGNCIIGYTYLDLINPNFWWHIESINFIYCRGTLEECVKYNYINDKGKAI